MKPAEMKIAGRMVGSEHPPFIIAEMSANHAHDLDRAIAIIRAAKDAGADAVKIQTYTPDTITLRHDSRDFQITEGLWKGQTLYDLYSKAYTPWEWHETLFAAARQIGIPLFSSPFDPSAIELLERCGSPAYKIASFELVDTPLIRRAAETGKPLIISTGMGSLPEIQRAVEAARTGGCRGLALLHCASSYPATAEDYRINAIPQLAREFDVVAGVSDHTVDSTVAVAATAVGSAIVEKHFTLTREGEGPDDTFSMQPPEFAAFCASIKSAWGTLRKATFGPGPGEIENLKFRRSLYAVSDIDSGERFTEKNVRSIRPSYGLEPRHLPTILGKKATMKIARGTALQWQHVEDKS